MVDIHEVFLILVRSSVMIVVLFLTTKMLGKKQISHLTIYDYIIGITIGSIAADIILTLDEKLFNGIIAIFLFGIIGFILSIISIKSEYLHTCLNGKATILMEHGFFNYENLKKTKIPIYKFIEQARLKVYYDLNVLNYAILETNGEISFLPKEEYQTSTPIDFKTELKKGTKQTFCDEVIVDGQICYDKLDSFEKDEKWLKEELKKKKIHSVEDVVLATLNEKEKLKVFTDFQ